MIPAVSRPMASPVWASIIRTSSRILPQPASKIKDRGMPCFRFLIYAFQNCTVMLVPSRSSVIFSVTLNAAIVDVPMVITGRQPMTQYKFKIKRLVSLIPAEMMGESIRISYRPPFSLIR